MPPAEEYWPCQFADSYSGKVAFDTIEEWAKGKDG
jgi:hypothetical protein